MLQKIMGTKSNKNTERLTFQCNLHVNDVVGNQAQAPRGRYGADCPGTRARRGAPKATKFPTKMLQIFSL